MSDNEAKSPEKSLFTAKEEVVLKVAWLCLKSGAPDIDMDRLRDLGGFNTTKTASNTWGVIKKKLNAQGDGFASPSKTAGGGDPGTPTKTPKKGTRAAKRPKKVEEEDDDEGEVRTLGRKKARKTEDDVFKDEVVMDGVVMDGVVKDKVVKDGVVKDQGIDG